jgi:periplasmic divalent cation tolerance protein
MRAPDTVFLYATAPDAVTARRIADALVARKAAACVNILPGMTSVYRWQDAVESASEVVLIVKCARAAAGRARAAILELHPAMTPAIACLAVDAECSSAAFLKWIEENSAL